MNIFKLKTTVDFDPSGNYSIHQVKDDSDSLIDHNGYYIVENFTDKKLIVFKKKSKLLIKGITYSDILIYLKFKSESEAKKYLREKRINEMPQIKL